MIKNLLLLFCCFPVGAFAQTGTFSVALTTTDSIVYDTPGAFMSVHGTIYNLSATDSAELSIEKQFVDIPGSWETALCTNICYPSTVNSVVLSIAPADSQEFVFYFYTDLVADSGYARVLYTNLNVPSNSVLHGYAGVTQEPMGIQESHEFGFTLYPNPAGNLIFLKGNSLYSREPYEITDFLGRVVMNGNWVDGEYAISISSLKAGTYVLRTGLLNPVNIKFVKE